MRKRSAYRPKRNLCNPLHYVLAGMMHVTVAAEPMLDLRIKNHSALAALQHGKATYADIDTLASCVNMSLAL